MKTRIMIFTLVLALSLVGAGLALANGGVALPRWVVSGGAADATFGGTNLQATIGQPVVGVVSGGDITLGQGFWHGGSVAAPGGGNAIYLPLVQR